MTHSQLPYAPTPSTASISPAAPLPATAQPPAQAQIQGAPVDLAHELAELRKIQYTSLVFSGLTMLFALFAAGFAGYVAYYVYHFVDALQKAFGD